MDTKKLRQKILDLAIRGKLVPQDPNDEPASVLLERIRAEKERLIQEGKIKRSKKSASDDEIEAPFEIPESWEWTTIGEIALSILYGVSESAKDSGNYKLLRITDIQNNKVNWDSVPFTNYDENKAQPYLLQDGDILFARTGATVGKSYLVEGLIQPSIYASYLIRVQTSSLILPSYIKFYFESGYYWEQISLSSVGIGQPNVNGTTLAALSIPIPPYKEQLRIASAVERWFTLIDELESNEGDLLKAIDKAKSKILDLAIHGKLVPQDPNDEPAIELLKRINPKFEPCDEVPWELPNNWCWSTLGNISDYGKCIHVEAMDIPNDSWVLELEDLEKDTAKLLQRVTCTEREIKGVRSVFRKGDILFSKLRTYLNKVLVAPEDGYCSTEIVPISLCDSLSSHYINHVLRSKYFVEYTTSCGYGVKMPRLSTTDARKGLIPLPPYQEQLRIVAKIEELFSVLDSIKESLEV